MTTSGHFGSDVVFFKIERLQLSDSLESLEASGGMLFPKT